MIWWWGLRSGCCLRDVPFEGAPKDAGGEWRESTAWCETAAQLGECPGEGAGSGTEQHV